ncbi:hypothetical protein Patl1_10141 [Pistacia atlantica]|uniref:Uncharacterized protein n=1 Tax=Pistacia atlantica TaxID=434234 RepID=A0ACC1A6H3_9ROSI|nr:hypothetical protein Patl1_10141 [Pistacia atlantica]
MDAQEANLVGKPNLRRLELSWELDSESESREKVEKVFEALQPHSNLEILKIQGYKGAKFPIWMDYKILSNVVSITLSNCENCRQLPPLWQLPRLRYLAIINLINLEYIVASFQGKRKFPSLEELYIDGLPRLQRLSRQDGSELFPCLTKLEIYDCPELTTLPCLPSAKSLVIRSCNGELLKSTSHFRSLAYLHLDTNCDLVYLPHGILQNLSSLRKMSIRNFKKLKGFTTDRVSLSDLKSLTIYECFELEAFSEQVLKGLNSLQELTVGMCIKFSNLSEGLRHLSALESLTLNECPELVTFPNGIKYLSSLRKLTICGKPSYICDSNCPKLTVLPESIRYEELVILQECREGGHTAEMMNLLSVLQMDRFAPRFYIAAATDNMSLQKARVFEDSLVHKNGVKGSTAQFMQIYRSREVGQSYITSVWTTLLAIAHALWLMIRIRPQVVLCNGPGTCIPLCVLGIRWSSVFYVESIARVKRLSLSGLLLYRLHIADQFFVQWPQLQRKHPQAHYVGCLM